MVSGSQGPGEPRGLEVIEIGHFPAKQFFVEQMGAKKTADNRDKVNNIEDFNNFKVFF